MSKKTVSKFFELTSQEDRTALLNTLRKELSLSRRYLISTADTADIILSPEGILDICHRFNIHVALDKNEPGYAVKYVLCREKAKNLVYNAAIVKGAVIPSLKAALGTKGAMVLNDATNVAKRLCAPSLKVIDQLYAVDFNEKIRSDEYLSIHPTLKVGLSDNAPASLLNVNLRLKDIITTVNDKSSDSKVLSADIGTITKSSECATRALWEREKFIFQRILSHNRDGRGHTEIIFNNSVRHGVNSTPRITMTYSQTKAVDFFIQNPVHDNNVHNLFGSKDTVYTYDSKEIETDISSPEFNEWRVGPITLAEVIYFSKSGQFANTINSDIFDVECFGIDHMLPSTTVDTNDFIILTSDSTLNRHLSPLLTFSLNNLFSNTNFSNDSLFNMMLMLGSAYNYNKITYKEMVHYKKYDSTPSFNAEQIHNKLIATNELNVCFVNVADVAIKAKENGDVLASFELGDKEHIERAIIDHNEKSSISFGYHSQFVGLASNSTQKHHTPDTSISDKMVENLHNDKYLLANIDTTIKYIPEVEIQKKRVLRNSGGIILETTNAAQLKQDSGVLKAKIVGEKSVVMEEFVKIGNRDSIELITMQAMYHEGKDKYQEITSFSNKPAEHIDHKDMDTISFNLRLNFNSLDVGYKKYIAGTSYESNFNDNLPNIIRLNDFFTGKSVGEVFSCNALETLRSSQNMFLLEGMGYSNNSINVAINHYELDKGNGELENLHFKHASDKHQKRISVILNGYISSIRINFVEYDAPVNFEIRARKNYKLLDFIKLRYHVSIDMASVAFNQTYKFIGINDTRLSELSREYSTISVTPIIYKLLTAEAILIVAKISHLRYFYNVFTNETVFDYLDAHIVQSHIRSYGSMFVSYSEAEKIILHGIALELITKTVATFESRTKSQIENLISLVEDGTISVSQRVKLNGYMTSTNAALWTRKMGAYFDIPSAINEVLGTI